MSIKIDGNINQYIELVGQSGETVKAEVQRIIDKLGCTPVIREVDKEFLRYGSSKSFWLLHDAGVEFHWENDMLTAVALHTQPSESSVSEYRPYTDSLFVNFSISLTPIRATRLFYISAHHQEKESGNALGSATTTPITLGPILNLIIRYIYER